MKAKISAVAAAATALVAIVAAGSAMADDVPSDEVVDSKDDIVHVKEGETVTLDEGTVISASEGSEPALLSSCPNGRGCVYRNGGFGSLILWINPGGTGGTVWVAHSAGRSAKNRYADRRLVLATGFSSSGQPQNRICIPAGGQSGQYNPFNPPRYYTRAGAKNQNANC